MDLRGKTFLITGASSGIGAATAQAAAAQGARVLLVARSELKLTRLAQEIRKNGGTASVYAADLSDLKAIKAVVARIQAQETPPDIIMNNAGLGTWKYARYTSPEAAAEMMAVPYLAAFAVTHAFLPQLIDRRDGMIVNVTSAAAYMVWPGATAYASARWAMRGFNNALRTELSPQGIQVMLVAFAKVTSDYWANNPGSEQHIPAGQSMIPELSPQTAATHILKGIQQDQNQVIEPWQLRAAIALATLFPGRVN